MSYKVTKKLLDYKEKHRYCEACHKPVAKTQLPHHIKTKGSGGSDYPENLLMLCPSCHFGTVHNLPGIVTLCRRYPHIIQKVVKQKPKLKHLLDMAE